MQSLQVPTRLTSFTIFTFIFVHNIHHSVQQAIESPCPDVLTLHRNSFDVGSWSGTLKLRLDAGTMGLFLQIDMDSQINLISNNFGVITTKNNQKYFLENFLYKPLTEVTRIDFNVKYNGANPTPQIQRIYVNGLQVCPDQPDDIDIRRDLKVNLKRTPKSSNTPNTTTNIALTAVGKETTTVTSKVRMPYTTIPFLDVEED